MYHWLHIETGARGTTKWSDHYKLDGVLVYHSELDRLRKLNEWNRQGQGNWLYWID